MKKLLLLFLLIVAAVADAKITLPEDTVRPDGTYNAYVMYGAMLPDSVLDSGTFVLPANIAEIDIPDSQLEILYLHNGSIVHGADKAPIFQLFHDAQRFIIGTDTLQRAEFANYPAALINSVTAQTDGTLLVDTRPSVHDISSAFRYEGDEEHVWLTKYKTALPSLPFVISYVTSYPDSALISVDYLLRSRSFAEAISPEDIKAFRVSMYGNRLHIEIFTRSDYSHSGSYGSDVMLIPTSQPKSLTLADILAELPANPRTITITPAYIIAYPR